ncbi:hypothetical protein LINPERPRIM_LOCUS15903 [Linum perenne]
MVILKIAKRCTGYLSGMLSGYPFTIMEFLLVFRIFIDLGFMFPFGE